MLVYIEKVITLKAINRSIDYFAVENFFHERYTSYSVRE